MLFGRGGEGCFYFGGGENCRRVVVLGLETDDDDVRLWNLAILVLEKERNIE